ncbi:glutathione S-transferase F11-like [Nicotiana tabacum]|uniref:glutathione transferase n=1 Tax=Nicotiana tabacum TaxID=4097 RepID=A0A193KWR1_TOBAC|nr:glutathione S-transferase F11 [Nicotiana tomentosiformis]XP_016434511.1 PREDICTED: glutathione S-transferase F11-like [Nicotiana tabacum]ANO39923.1 glutathione S-transferase [Nicotiana tabacum]
MVVKVYGSAMAACPQRVMVCLIELGVNFELIHVDLDSLEQKKPEFLTLQPFGQVPVIEDGDFRLFESRAIIRYYAAKYEDKGTKLTGKTLEEKAVVDQWLEVESNNFNDLVYNMVLQLVVFPKMGQNSDLTLVHKCADKLEKVFDIYEQRLSKSKYLAGDFFSLADLSHLPSLRFLMNEGGFAHLVTERKCLNDWYLDISSRPAWNKVLELMIMKKSEMPAPLFKEVKL